MLIQEVAEKQNIAETDNHTIFLFPDDASGAY